MSNFQIALRLNKIFQNKGVLFLLKFLLLYFVLLWFNKFYIGITSPGGSAYSPFLEAHLNYIAWWRSAILYGANVIAHMFGVASYVDLPYKLSTIKTSVVMVYSCLGYGVTSFWLAFVLANEGGWMKKFAWALGGAIAIFVINCFRVALLLVALTNGWKVNSFADNHTLFNIAAYGAIFLLIFLFTRKTIEPQSHRDTE